MLRPVPTIALAAAAAGLAACANGPPRAGPTATELEELQAACEARGGVLVPSGAATGRPALDEVCKIPDASRLPR